jgi:hypothetical protein
MHRVPLGTRKPVSSINIGLECQLDNASWSIEDPRQKNLRPRPRSNLEKGEGNEGLQDLDPGFSNFSLQYYPSKHRRPQLHGTRFNVVNVYSH